MFVRAEERSAAFRKFLADGLTRTLVAARAREISARTGGLILAQLLFDLTRAGGRADRVLDAPTNEAWIDPWVAHLRALGVDVRLGTPVEGVDRARRADRGGHHARRHRDRRLLRRRAARRGLARCSPGRRCARSSRGWRALDRLVTRWMNGVLFYLDRDVPLVHGHAIYIDSEWALTSISQAQFWRESTSSATATAASRGSCRSTSRTGRRPGARTGKVAARCTREEIRTEVWGQLTDHLNDGRAVLDERHVLAWFLDPAIEFPNPSDGHQPRAAAHQHGRARGPTGRTPRRGSRTCCSPPTTCAPTPTWRRWRAPTRRRGARSTRSSTPPARTRQRCEVFRLREPAVLAPARKLDELRWRLFHRPARPPLRVAADGGLEPRSLLSRATLAAGQVGSADAVEACLAAARFERVEPERLHRPERSGAAHASGRAARAHAMIPAVSPYGSAPERCTSASFVPAASKASAGDPRDPAVWLPGPLPPTSDDARRRRPCIAPRTPGTRIATEPARLAGLQRARERGRTSRGRR